MREDTSNIDSPSSNSLIQNSDNGTSTSTYIDGSINGDITIPNGTFLLDAEYSRVGNDMVLETPDGQNVIIGDYFSQSDAATLVNDAGAAIKGSVATQLAGPLSPGQYAQTGTLAAEGSIGALDKVTGEITITGANGATRSTNSGDPIFEGDVLTTGSDGALGIIFTDSSTMSMSENGRIVLDEMVYNPDDSSGSQVFEVVQGAFMYTSGLVGKFDPDSITVNTPVATIGIRGTKYAVDVKDEGGETTVVIFEGAITVGNGAGQVLLDEVGFYTIVAGADVMPTEPVLMPQSLLELLMARAILFHPEEQLTDIDDLIDDLENLETAGGGNPPILLTSDSGTFGGVGLGGGRDASGPLAGVGESNIPDSDDGPDANPNDPNNFSFTPGTTTSGGGTTDNDGIIRGTVNDDTGGGVISGTAGDDIVWGLAGNDVIIGGTGYGDDQYYGGDDTVDTGESDWVIYPSATDSITVDLDAGSPDNPNFDHIGMAVDTDSEANPNWIDTDTLFGIENILGGDGDDIVEGDTGDNSLVGGIGDDTLAGNLGSDTIVGDNINGAIFNRDDDTSVAGDDTLYGGASGEVRNFGGNYSIATALNIDNDFVERADDEIEGATTNPHTSISSIGAGEFEYYEFEVHEDGSIGIFDIDHGLNGDDDLTTTDGDVDTWIMIVDADGNIIADNDDRNDNDGPKDPDSGSFHSWDSYLEHKFVAAGTYYVVVGQYFLDVSGSDPISYPVPLDEGTAYELQVSVENHSVPLKLTSADTIIGDHQTIVVPDDDEQGNFSYANAHADSAGNDTIFGSDGDDTLIGDSRAIATAEDFPYYDEEEFYNDYDTGTTIGSGVGFDNVVVSDEGEGGANAQAYASATAGNDDIFGGAGDDTIIGDSQLETSANAQNYDSGSSYAYSRIQAEAGNDVIDAGNGSNTVIGDNDVSASSYADQDRYNYYDYAESNSNVNISAGMDTIISGDDFDTIAGDNKVEISSTASSYDYEGEGEGFDSPDYATIHATVAAGADYIDGGDGGGVIIGDNDVSLNASVYSAADGKINIGESDRYGSDEVIINSADDEINGGAGVDTIIGDNKISITTNGYADGELDVEVAAKIGGGPDTNAADEATFGNDVIYGGAGGDTIIGDNDFDLDYNTGSPQSGISVNSGDDTIYGEDGDDTIYGDNRANTEKPPFYNSQDSTGDDLLDGGADNDLIYGNEGSDWIVGGTDNGTVSFASHDGGPFIFDANGSQVSSFSTGDNLYGHSGGGSGGGSDKDVFFYRDGDGVDTIKDFEIGTDQLVIDGYTADDMTFFQDGNDTVISFGADSGDAIKLVGVPISTFLPFDDVNSIGNLGTYVADTGAGDENEVGNGTLSAEELIDLRDDLFDDTTDAPTASNAAVVILAPFESIDDGGTDPDIP